MPTSFQEKERLDSPDKSEWTEMAKWEFARDRLHIYVTPLCRSVHDFAAPVPPRSIFEKRFYGALELDQERLAVTINSFSGHHTDPALAHTIFLDIRLLHSVETDSDVAFKNCLVVMRAFRVDAQTIWQYVRHDIPLLQLFAHLHWAN